MKLVIIASDAIIRKALSQYFSSTGLIEATAMPCNASRVLRYFAKRTPDVILLNLDVHTLDIISALDKAKGETKIPTLFLLAPELLSTLANRNLSVKSRHSDYVIKPERNLMRNIRFLLPQIEEKIWFLSHAPTQLSRAKPTAASPIVEQDPVPIRPSALPSIPEPQTMPKPPRGTVSSKNQKNLVAIGTSTGGTSALMSVLSALPRTCPGIVAVVHMPSSFTKAFADRLDTLCSIDVLEATDHLPVRQGQAIIACGGKHLEVQKRGAGYWVKVTQGDLVNGHCPSVDRLFFSVATAAKQHAMGILMTGMGRDGAKGLLQIKDAGGKTVAQDETTSVVFGMPKAAIDLGASDKVVKLQDIAAEILHP
jgi:two-component system chemotaxis response regulator CheB